MEEQRSTVETGATGCYQCGASDGTMLRLCRACLDSNEQRRNALKESLTVDNDPKNNPISFQFINSFAMQLATIITLFIVIAIPLVAVALMFKASPLSAILIAIFLTAIVVALFSWVFFWVNLLIDEAPCAVAALFVPFVAYRYALLHWQETRYLFLFHILSVFIAITSGSTAFTRAIDFNSLRKQVGSIDSMHYDNVTNNRGSKPASVQDLFRVLENQELSDTLGTNKGALSNLQEMIKLKNALQAAGNDDTEVRKIFEQFGSPDGTRERDSEVE